MPGSHSPRYGLSAPPQRVELVSVYETTIRKLRRGGTVPELQDQLIEAEDALLEHARRHPDVFGLPKPYWPLRPT